MIQRIHIKNFKSLRENTVDCKHLNLLTGLNSMGKSSLIQVLLLLRQSYQKELLSKKEKYLALQGDYVDIGNFADAIYQDFAKGEDFIKFQLDFDAVPGITWQTNVEYTAQKEYNELAIKEMDISEELFEEALFAKKRFQYIKAERIGPRDILPVNKRLLDNKDFGVDGLICQFAHGVIKRAQTYQDRVYFLLLCGIWNISHNFVPILVIKSNPAGCWVRQNFGTLRIVLSTY